MNELIMISLRGSVVHGLVTGPASGCLVSFVTVFYFSHCLSQRICKYEVYNFLLPNVSLI